MKREGDMNLTAADNPRRVVFLDELRGLCVLLMVVYHALYDLVYLFGVNLPFRSLPFQILQLFICCSFITISGISSRFSRSNLKRGVMVMAVALTMSLVTWLAMPEQIVRFGVLHLLGVCMILHGLLYANRRFEKAVPFLGMMLCLLLFAVTWGVPGGYIGFFDIELAPLPSVLYSQYVAFPLGFPTASFYSSDYFPLLPWAFLFFAGSFLGVAFREGFIPQMFYRTHSRFLRQIGRHTLLIYIAHQPILYGLLTAIFLLLRRMGVVAA
jgi:uncharacterized membrane protein